MEDESTEKTAADETTQNPEDLVTMTTQKTVEDVTTEMDIEEATKREPMENMTEITTSSDVMQDTEETTTSLPIEPETSDKEKVMIEEEKESSEEDILVSIETTTLSATEASSQEPTEMGVNEEEKEIEEAGMTTVGPIVANGDSTESDLASTIQPEIQDDDVGADEDYKEVTERDEEVTEEITTVRIVSVNEEEDDLTTVVVTTASPLLDLVPQTTTISPETEDDEAETAGGEGGEATSQTGPIEVTTIGATTMQPEDVNTTTEEGSGSHELLCQEMSSEQAANSPADHLPLECHLLNSTDQRTVTIHIDKQKVNIDRLFAKNVKVIVKELMVMDVEANSSQRRRRRRK